jgi:uncharacterized protein YndB with AHSA1/START domain
MGNAEPIVVERTYRAPIASVWRAITDETEMPLWFFEPIRSFRPELGSETRFTVHNEGRDYVHAWKVTEVIPGKKIAYDWRYPGIPGESVVVWELSETADGTRLRLTHTGVETFPQDGDPAFLVESGRAGWNHFLGERLKAHLEGRTSAR